MKNHTAAIVLALALGLGVGGAATAVALQGDDPPAVVQPSTVQPTPPKESTTVPDLPIVGRAELPTESADRAEEASTKAETEAVRSKTEADRASSEADRAEEAADRAEEAAPDPEPEPREQTTPVHNAECYPESSPQRVDKGTTVLQCANVSHNPPVADWRWQMATKPTPPPEPNTVR